MSDILDILSTIYFATLGFATIILNAIVLGLVHHYANGEMRRFCWFLLNTSLIDLCNGLLYVAIQPLTTIEQGYLVIFLVGPVKPLLNTTIGELCFCVAAMLFDYYLICLPMTFVYRYILVCHPTLVARVDSTRCFLLVWLSIIALVAIAVAAYYLSLIHDNEWQLVYRSANFYLPIDASTIAIVFNYRQRATFWIFMFFLGFINIFTYAIIGFTVAQTYAQLKRQQSLMSSASRRIHYFVLRSQTIQVVVNDLCEKLVKPKHEASALYHSLRRRQGVIFDLVRCEMRLMTIYAKVEAASEAPESYKKKSKLK